MSAYLRRAWIVVWKDVLSERRSKESLNALVFFALLLLFVFQFTLGPERARVEAALPGLLWLGFILSGLLAFGRTFLVERENDCWEGLVLTPGDKSAIYVGKLAGNVLLMAVVEAVLLVLFAVFFGFDFTGVLPALALVFALGTLGLAAVGTLFGAITAQMRARELLFPVLLLPAVVRFNAHDPEAHARYHELAAEADLGPIEELIGELETILDVAKMRDGLGKLGIARDALPKLAAEAAKQWTATFNPRPIAAEDFEQLYVEALGL